jgi:ribosomal protein S20
MNWRRVAEVLRLREAVRLMDERDAADERLDAVQSEVDKLAEETIVQAEAARDMKNQARLGSYGRIRIDR